jgi:hypothetical protein
MKEYFGSDEVVDISTRSQWIECHFDNCLIIGKPQRSLALIGNKFDGRAAIWYEEISNSTNCIEITLWTH